MAERRPAGDEAETIDRLFLLRTADRLLYLPRSPAVAAALGRGERDGTWYLLLADHPFAAFSHQRQVLAEVPGHAAAGDCKECPVQAIATGEIEAALGKCEELGAHVMPYARDAFAGCLLRAAARQGIQLPQRAAATSLLLAISGRKPRPR